MVCRIILYFGNNDVIMMNNKMEMMCPPQLLLLIENFVYISKVYILKVVFVIYFGNKRNKKVVSRKKDRIQQKHPCQLICIHTPWWKSCADSS